MRLVLLGPPGVGQGHAGAPAGGATAAVPLISTGEILREAVAHGDAARARGEASRWSTGLLVAGRGDDRPGRGAPGASRTRRAGSCWTGSRARCRRPRRWTRCWRDAGSGSTRWCYLRCAGRGAGAAAGGAARVPGVPAGVQPGRARRRRTGGTATTIRRGELVQRADDDDGDGAAAAARCTAPRRRRWSDYYRGDGPAARRSTGLGDAGRACIGALTARPLDGRGERSDMVYLSDRERDRDDPRERRSWWRGRLDMLGPGGPAGGDDRRAGPAAEDVHPRPRGGAGVQGLPRVPGDDLRRR